MKIVCTDGRFTGTIEDADEEMPYAFIEKRGGGVKAFYPKPLWKLVDDLPKIEAK